jgi:ASCH domain
MANMKASTRSDIVTIAMESGFAVLAGANREDLFEKLITLSHLGLRSRICLDKNTGISKSGEIGYLKVAMHPGEYRDDLESGLEGISAAINRKTGANLHSHSGYQGFPYGEANNEPVGKAYKVANLDALRHLFQRLADSKIIASKPAATPAVSVDSGFKSPVSILTQDTCRDLPSRGLVIDTPWIDLILAGEKTWEMRSTHSSKRGRIALIRKGSGLIVGYANLVDSVGPLSEDALASNTNKHQITAERFGDGSWMGQWNHAWVLSEVQQLPQPIPYKHPSGAVIWVDLAKAIVQ